MKTSMLPAGGASLGTQSDMHSWECRSHDNLILCSPFVVALVYMCLVTACVCLCFVIAQEPFVKQKVKICLQRKAAV